ncbi:hypothetical protein ACFLU4_05585 [Chloroflexota bacterium]
MKFVYKFKTPLPLDECQRRLTNTTGFFKQFSGSGIKGVTLGKWFLLWYLRRISFLYVRNSFAPVCIGGLHSNNGQTLIRCYIGMHPLVVLFLFIWFGGLIGMGGFVLVKNGFNMSFIILCFFIGLMLMGGLALVFLGRAFSIDDESELRQFVRTTFNTD